MPEEEEEEEEDDLELDEEDQELTSHMRKEKSSFLGRMTGVFCACVCNPMYTPIYISACAQADALMYMSTYVL